MTGASAAGGEPIFSFDGGPESFVSVSDELTFQPSLGFSITAWVQQVPGNIG